MSIQIFCIPSFPEKALPLFPVRASSEAACYDVFANITGRNIFGYSPNNTKIMLKRAEDDSTSLLIPPGYRALVPTGWIFQIPAGYSMRLHARSGLALKSGITLMNAEGIIDSDYTDETFVMLYNASNMDFIVENDVRIAQIELVVEMPPLLFRKSDTTLDEYKNAVRQSSDRNGGFGSTGEFLQETK